MAYDASNTQNNQQQVAGSTPLSQGGGQSAPMAQGDQAPTSGPSTPATIQAGQSSTQAAQSQQPQQSNKPASSGMFTNIKSYVEKNQPAAQKMAGAVSQNVGDQASQIREQADKKAQQQKDAIAANNKTIEQEAAWASTNINNVIGGQPQTPPATQNQPQTEVSDPAPEVDVPPAPVVPEFSEEDMTRMQALTRGELQGITQVGDLNLAQQQAKIQALQSMAQGANTEQGRINILKNTFGNRGDTQYTRGLSGLDQLIVSGDQAAREQMVQGTQGQVQELSQDVQGIQQDVNDQRMAQEQALRGFGSDIQEQINKGLTGIDTDLQTKINQEIAARKNLLPQYQEDLEAMQTTYGSMAQEMNNVLNSGNLTSGVDVSKLNLSPQALEKIGLTQEQINSLSSRIPTTYIRGRQLYPGGPREKIKVLDTAKIGQRKQILEKLSGGLNSLSSSDPFSASLTEKGFSMDKLLAGEDLTKSNLATQEQVDRFNMLKKFMGQSNFMDKGNYATSEDINAALSGLQNYIIPTGPRKTT
jgi:hypothetical protein